MKALIIAIVMFMVVLVGAEEELKIDTIEWSDTTFTTDTDWSIIGSHDTYFVFCAGNREVLKITSDGRFYANGKLMIEKDKRLYELMVKWFEKTNSLVGAE